MNLTIDIGNTNILFCSFMREKVIKFEKLNIQKVNKRTVFKIFKRNNIDDKTKILVSSVVPRIKREILEYIKCFKIKVNSLNSYMKSLKIKTNIKDKKSIGEDRIVNAYYANILLKNTPVIIIDFGTATTVDVINSDGIYDGGIITPGIELSLKVLSERTAKLPLVTFSKTKSVIGRNTKEAIQSGFFWGSVEMINGLVKKVNQEKGLVSKVILTGGNCKYFKGLIDNVVINDDLFNAKGLNYIINKFVDGYEYKKR